MKRTDKKCGICSELFTPRNSLNKYCSSKCGYEAELSRRSKKPKTKTCSFCTKIFKPYTSLDKFCSTNCRIENMKSSRGSRWTKESVERRKGKNNPNYKHGLRIGKIKSSVGMKEFHKVRDKKKADMKEECGYLFCENCKRSDTRKFEMHHIVFRSEKPEHKHLHSKENLINLCVKCHNFFHKKKSNRNQLVEDRNLEQLFDCVLTPIDKFESKLER